jgi:uncharacterized OB-fold protein
VEDEKYVSTMDVFPLQTKEFNKLYPFYDALRDNRFTTTKCNKCGAMKWPPRTICPECVSDDLEWVPLSSTARVETFSVEEVGVPEGFDTPLIHALVTVDDTEITIFSRIVDAKPEQLEDGMRVGLKVLDISGDRVTFAYKPV